MSLESNNPIRRAEEPAVETSPVVEPIQPILSLSDNSIFFNARSGATTNDDDDDGVESGGTSDDDDDDDDDVLDAGDGYSFVHVVRPEPWDSNNPVRLHSSGHDFESSGNMQSAQNCYEALVRLYESGVRGGQPQHLELASALDDLARIQLRRNNPEGAERSLLRSLELNQAHRPANDPQLAFSHERLGDFYQSTGRAQQPTEHFRANVAIQENNNNPNNLREARMRLANNYQTLNNHAGALDVLRQVVRSATPAPAEGDRPAEPDTPLLRATRAQAHALMAESLARTGDHRGSQQSLDLAMEYRRTNGPNDAVDRAIIRSLTGLADMDIPDKKGGTGDMAAVLRRLEQADSIARETFGANSPEFARARGRLGNARTWNGDYNVGEALLRESLAIQENRLGESHADSIFTRQSLIQNLIRNNNGPGALELANRHIDIIAGSPTRGPNHPDVAEAAELGIRAAQEANEPFVAVAMAQRAANVLRQHRQQRPNDYMYALGHLASLEERAGLEPNALATTTLMVDFARDAYRNNPDQLGRALRHHASVLQANGLENDANRINQEADRVNPQDPNGKIKR